MIATFDKAKGGDMKSLQIISECYGEGLCGFPKSFPKFVDCHEKMAQRGNSGSQAILGWIYASSSLSAQANRIVSSSKSERWLRQAYMSAETPQEKDFVEEIRVKVRQIQAERSIESHRSQDIDRGVRNPSGVSEGYNLLRTGLMLL